MFNCSMGTFYFKVSSIYRLYSKYPNCQFSFNFYNCKKLQRGVTGKIVTNVAVKVLGNTETARIPVLHMRMEVKFKSPQCKNSSSCLEIEIQRRDANQNRNEIKNTTENKGKVVAHRASSLIDRNKSCWRFLFLGPKRHDYYEADLSN